MATETQATSSLPSKFSRYKSVRDAARIGQSSLKASGLFQLAGSDEFSPLHTNTYPSDVGDVRPLELQNSEISPPIPSHARAYRIDRQRRSRPKRQEPSTAQWEEQTKTSQQSPKEKISLICQQNPNSLELQEYKHSRQDNPFVHVLKTAEDSSTGRYGMFPRQKGNKSSETPMIFPCIESKSKAASKDMILAPNGIQPGGRGIVPGIDAPVSAVNARERSVTVKYNKSSILLPVLPFTTPNDIIRSAADSLSDKIDTETAVLLESFKQLGLERPLRRYEHLRDVLNGWDQDDQNVLLIVPSSTGSSDEDLSIMKVPSKAPGDISAHMYYSQKPGSWDKRWITLREDGQVLTTWQNSNEAKYICHMRDFDIYIPTPRQISKKLRPPKKLCLAIKSQHKTSMFLSTANFVHFFSTEDKEVASAWYKGVQEWRSWHLVNIMGNGKAPPQSLEESGQHTTLQRQRQELNHHTYHPNHVLIDSATSLNKSVQPPCPVSPLNRSLPTALRVHDGKAIYTRSMTMRSRVQPSASSPKSLDRFSAFSALPNNGKSSAFQRAEEKVTESAELLDRKHSYQQEEDSQRNHPAASNHISTSGIQTLWRTSPTGETLPSRFSSKDGFSMARAGTQRQKPRPLIDLTPQYKELPQHKKGKGLIPEQIPVGGLVDIARSPEVAIMAPPATTWRRPRTSSGREKS